MDIEGADDPELTPLRIRYKASIQSSDMTREELIDTLAWNLAMYELLDRLRKEANASMKASVASANQEAEALRKRCIALEQQLDASHLTIARMSDGIPEIIGKSLKLGGKALASRAGKKGAVTRHASTRALKEWALEEASRMRGPMKTIAKQLVLRLPPDVAQASKEPERFIYDALRLQARPPKPKKAKGLGFHPNTRSRQP